VHLVLTHFISPAQVISFATVQGRLGSLSIAAVDYSLLFLGLLHGLYGLHIVLNDVLPGWVRPKAIAICLTVIGVGLGTLGAYTLSIFLRA
jgi:succinate dehydrogenase hydrophobic anchor subunit